MINNIDNMNSADVLVDCACLLGEGVYWDDQRQRLYWVDITAANIHSCVENGSDHRIHAFPEMAGFIIPSLGKTFVVGGKSGIWSCTLPDESGPVLNPVKLFDLTTENTDEAIRFNDGCADSEGRIWAGTMDMNGRNALGKLYSFHRSADGKLHSHIHDEGFTITNGPAISADGRWLYASDTPNQKLYRYEKNGDTLGPRQLFIDYAEFSAYPDGMYACADGRLVIAEWQGWGLRIFNRDGKSLEKIHVPAPYITKPGLGGSEMNTLYISSAVDHLKPEDKKKAISAGAIYACESKLPAAPIHRARI